MSISHLATTVIGDKRRWRAYKARTAQLPDDYRAVADALERYVTHFGPSDGDSVLAMVEDLASQLEAAAAGGRPIRDVVGQDPVAFAEALLETYAKSGWITRERERLTDAIDRAAADRT